jgi:hypothetical protein
MVNGCSFPLKMVLIGFDPPPYNYGKSPFLMGKSTINGHFQ